ncbi:MAG TPA: BlaI/MecI/CopY family transcriptional regulator [Methylomirabilota bacterium]|nr:BlaI/MecI/CopY family transcriptional regulator [Methylomirabilota bacterium]
MKKAKPAKPTEAELSILKVLWRQGPCTVRQVWDQISPEQRTGYTTVLKIMQIMAEKGLLERDERQRSHVYKPRQSQDQTQRQVVGHLLERLFAGSAPRLVMQLLATRKASPEELAEIRKLLDQAEGKRP